MNIASLVGEVTKPKLRWDLWIYGLASAVIGGGASSVTAAIGVSVIDPEKFNLNSGLKATLILIILTFFMNALICLFTYLKVHPVPEWDGIVGSVTDRRVVTDDTKKEN